MTEFRIENQNGVDVKIYKKKCPYCHKTFETTSGRQKYCSDECSKKYNKRRQDRKKVYSKVKEIERLRVRSHSLAVDMLKQLVSLGYREWKCECCGSTENLEVHHVNQFNWLNNSPDNLKILCHKCHTKEHSKVEKELAEQGLLVEEWYNKSMQPFHKILNK